MKQWRTTRGTAISLIKRGRSNAYLVSAAGHHIMADTGKKQPVSSLVRALEKAGAGRLDAIILTHSHYDHAENAAALKDHYRAPVIVHRNDAAYLEEGDSPIPRGSLAVTRLLTDSVGAIIQPHLRYDPVHPDVLADERLELSDFGIPGYLLHTPGHSEGSCSLIIDEEIAVAGDALMGVYPGSIFIPFADDIPEMVRSWKKLLETGCRLFLPGHGGAVASALVEREYERYRKKFGL